MTQNRDPLLAKLLYLHPDKSMFKSRWFGAIAEGLEKVYNFKARYDFTDSDFIAFAAGGCELGHTPFSLKTVGGILNDGTEIPFPTDPVNFQHLKCSYTLGALPRMPQYFLDNEITEMLMNTHLQWMDLEIFKDLPDAFTMKIPRGLLWMESGGEEFGVEDIMLGRVKVPMCRRFTLWQHGMLDRMDDPDTQVFYWTATSRDELEDGTQNSTFGVFFIDGHMKLDDMMAKLDDWGADHAKMLVAQTSPELTAKLDQEAAEQAMLAIIKGENPENITRAREFLRDMLDPDSVLRGVQRNRALMEMLFKFIMLRSSIQFGEIAKEKLPPGLKPGKTSVKAKEIHAKLWKDWGTRFFVTAPQLSPEERKSPTRHLVHGFFRRQAYGVGRSLRKIIFVQPFWRGKVELG